MEANVTDIDRNELWQNRLQELAASDMTQKEWCRKNNIPESTLRYWIRKLRPAETSDEKAADPKGWIQMPKRIGPGNTDGELMLSSGGVRLILSRDADPGLRARLLKVMIDL